MLALNRVQVMKRAKPALWWFVTVGCSLFGILAVWMSLDDGGVIPWLIFLFFGGGAFLFGYLGLKPARHYEPGVSFNLLRRPDATIIRNYRLTILAGVIITLATIVWKLAEGLNSSTLGRGLVGGIGLAAYGYYGLIAKRVHDNVDAVAVDLAHEHGSSRRDKIYLAYLNFTASDEQNKAGNAILLVGADRLLMCRYGDGSWRSSEQPFSSIESFGFMQRNSETGLYFEFDSGNIFQMALDPTCITTTEPQTFVRSFLSLLDSWCEAPQGTIAPTSRRRIVTNSIQPADTVGPIALVGQAQEAQFATAAIDGALAAFAPQPRQLEI